MSQLGAASRCDCQERARCESRCCESLADWSVYYPKWPPRPAGFMFMCDVHKRIHIEAWTKPMKGIDRPEHADDVWRGSILEHVRHAKIAIDFEERDKQNRIAAAQAGQMEAWRQGLRNMRTGERK